MTIEELNEAVETGEIDEVIRVCEARQVRRFPHWRTGYARRRA